MSCIKRLVLDVLKPHSPNVVEFAQRIADDNDGCRVQVTVSEMDENTGISGTFWLWSGVRTLAIAMVTSILILLFIP